MRGRRKRGIASRDMLFYICDEVARLIVLVAFMTEKNKFVTFLEARRGTSDRRSKRWIFYSCGISGYGGRRESHRSLKIV